MLCDYCDYTSIEHFEIYRLILLNRRLPGLLRLQQVLDPRNDKGVTSQIRSDYYTQACDLISIYRVNLYQMNTGNCENSLFSILCSRAVKGRQDIVQCFL